MSFQQAISNYGVSRLTNGLVSHIEISLIVLVICLIIGVPLGILAARNKMTTQIVLGIANVMKVIPSLAVMLILIPITGAGIVPAVFALTLLGLPPIMVNTCLGIRNVDPHITEAAAGIGMDPRTVLFKIQIPLSIPMMMTGIRTSAVSIVACTTIASYVGAGGLGTLITYGLRQHINPLLLTGSLLVALMTAFVDRLFAFLQEKVNNKYSI